MTLPIRRLALMLVAFVAALALLPAATASAHSGEQSYVYLEIFDDAIAGRVEYPVGDLNDATGLGLPEDDADELLPAMEASRAAIEQYTRDHLAIGPADGSTTWSYSFDEFETLDVFRDNYAIVHFEIDERFDPPPRTLTLRYDGIIENDSSKDAFLLIATDWDSGTFNNEGDEFLRYTSDNVSQVVDLDDASWWKGFSGTVDLGVEHIRIGTDHIMFVLALVLPAVLVFARWPGDEHDEWYPSPSFGSSLWRILKIATMFTIAHTITLALGGFGIVELPERLVETVIAISIALAALHNIRPIFPNKEWMLAFGFGLFHGFGFAGLLSELGLDRSNRFTSLLGFNLGVEIGQAVIILMVIPSLFMLRRTRFYRPVVLVGGSLVLAWLSVLWASERVFEIDTRVDRLIDPLVEWPRALFLLGGVFLVSVGIWALERSRGRLLPVYGDTDEPGDPDIDIDDLVLVDA